MVEFARPPKPILQCYRTETIVVGIGNNVRVWKLEKGGNEAM